MRRLIILAVTITVSFLFPLRAVCEMSSASYQIYADNIESGGGDMSASMYSLQETLGENASGVSVGGVYEIRAGYQYMEQGGLSMVISPGSVNLGDLSVSAVSQGTAVATVSTDSSSGYSLSVSSVSGNSLAGVADGSVTAGSEEYGISGSGSENQLTGDVAVVENLVVASSVTSISDSETTLTFKASISPTTPSGSYGQSVVFTALSNF